MKKKTKTTFELIFELEQAKRDLQSLQEEYDAATDKHVRLELSEHFDKYAISISCLESEIEHRK